MSLSWCIHENTIAIADSDSKIIAVSAEHIKETLIALSYNFDKINQGFEDFPVLLQGNNMVKVSEVLKNFADDFDLLCRTVSLTALFPE